MKTNDRNEKLNPTNLQELTLEEMENVTGGGVKEVVAATTLAAMAVTGNTVSAFRLARALAEEAPAHIEEAPEREAYGTEYDGVTVDDIEDVASEPVEAFSEAIEAPVEEVAMELGGEAAALPMEESAVELADAAVEALPENPVFEIGTRKVFKLDALAAACGITGTVENVGTTNDDDTLKFVVFTDEAGELAIEFPHSFDALELAFFTEGGIQTVTLVNAVIPEAENFVEEVPTEEAPLAEAAAPTEEAAPVQEEAAAEEVLAEEASAEEETPVEEDVTEEAPAEEETAEEAPVEEEAVAEEASEPVMILTEDGAVEVAEKAMDAEETGESHEKTEAELEAEAIAAAEARRELMAGMIDSSVEARRTEGIYAALDNTFATLAEYAQALANPETGVIDAEGGDIIVMTYDALNARFDNTPEQLMGAIGAAALRAEDAGYIQALGGDAVLSAMAAEEGDAEVDINMAKDLAKDYLELGIDTLADVHPAFKALSPLLKGLLGVAFDESQPDPMQEMQKKLDEIDHKLDEIEESVKSHTDNVVSLSNRGLAFDNIVANSKTLRTRMNNIWDPDSGYTQAEKIQQTADLYKTDYVKDLETALNGGTMAYEGTLKDRLDGQSVFEAAYRTACESVMFSSEAIDSTAPYLYQVLADYIVGYNLLDEVYDCYEAVYGANKLLASRDDMNARLAGIDRKGNKVCKSVMDLYVEYFKRDRYIFVGKSNNKNIKLNDTMVLVQNFAKECQINDNIMKTPDCMKNNPLSDKDVQLIADYCKEKRKSLFQYLLNEMKFDLKVVYNNKTYTASDIRKDLVLSTHCVVGPNFMGGGWAYNHGPINGTKYKELPQEIYLATGKQYITQNDKSKAYGMGVYTNTYWYYAQGVDATGYCTGKDEKVQIMKRTEDSATLEKKNSAKDTDYYCTFMFFQGR